VEEVMVVGDKDGKERTLAGRRKLARFGGIITVTLFTIINNRTAIRPRKWCMRHWNTVFSLLHEQSTRVRECQVSGAINIIDTQRELSHFRSCAIS
jgi:hypothetical protein